MKSCSRCHSSKPETEFVRQATHRDGLTSDCKACRKIVAEQYNAAHPEVAKARRRRWFEKNRDKVYAQTKEWRESHPETVKRMKYNNRHKPENAAKIRKWDRARSTEKNRRYRELNLEKTKALQKRWWERNPLKIVEYRHRRRALVKKSGGSFSVSEWKELLERYDNKCLACGSTDRLTADHVLPLSKGGRNTIDNIQILCYSCNSRKRTRPTDYRQQAQPV